MCFAGTDRLGKAATWLAGIFMPPYLARVPLARMNANGYVSPKAEIFHPLLSFGKHVFLDDSVLIYPRSGWKALWEIGDAVHLFRGTTLLTGQGGSIRVGARTHIQPSCQLSAYKASITIGQRVEIAPYCTFFPYNTRHDGRDTHSPATRFNPKVASSSRTMPG